MIEASKVLMGAQNNKWEKCQKKFMKETDTWSEFRDKFRRNDWSNIPY